MITIKDLHRYKKLSDKGLVPSIVCPVDVLHTDVVPWTENDEVCLWCIYCDSKITLGMNKQIVIKELLGQ